MRKLEPGETFQCYRCCDLCFRGMEEKDYRPTGFSRPVTGTGDLTDEIFCPKCWDAVKTLYKPPEV